jgi:DNA-directed RNA polymerase subunit alpha
MAVKYGKFEMPEKIKVDESTKSSTFAKFVVEPFEKGFGHTIGTTLRRVMLGALEAPSILSIRIEGVPHEYMAIEGVIQDMTHIILNLKGGLLRRISAEEGRSAREPRQLSKQLEITEEMIERKGGAYKVTMKDLLDAEEYELINPDHHLFTVTRPLSKRVDLRIANGRGYVPSERHSFEKVHDEIVIDSAFSPVRLVNYFVENTRVGQDTDFDRLILEVTTDGRVTPIEALTFAAQIAIQHIHVFETIKTHSIIFDKGEAIINRDRDEILAKLALKINEIELSVRSTNCLANANIETIGELVVMPESEMLRFRNFGKKSLTEIKQKLDELGLSLGMDLAKYGINRDNIKAIIQNYLIEKAGNIET